MHLKAVITVNLKKPLYQETVRRIERRRIVIAAEHPERVSSIPDWLPPEDLSEPVRLTAFRMFGRDHNPAAFYSTNGLLIQGLLQIHRDYCLQVHPDCTGCELIHEKGNQNG